MSNPTPIDDCTIANIEHGPLRKCVEGMFLLVLRKAGLKGDSSEFQNLHDAIVPRLMELAVCETVDGGEFLVAEAESILLKMRC